MTDGAQGNDTDLDRYGDALDRDVDMERDAPSVVTALAPSDGASVTPLDVTSLPLDRAGLMEFTEKFGGPHGIMRWVSMAAGAPSVPPQLLHVADAAQRGEPISFELRVGSAFFRFDFK